MDDKTKRLSAINGGRGLPTGAVVNHLVLPRKRVRRVGFGRVYESPGIEKGGEEIKARPVKK